MNQKMLGEIRKEFAEKKHDIQEHNDKVKRIRTLEKDELVMEYLGLRNIGKADCKYIKDSDDKIVSEIYKKYLLVMKEEDTNSLYFYLGTYRILNGKEKRVSFNDRSAEYRLYWNIERLEPVKVNRNDFDTFMEGKTILSTYYHSKNDYYSIQNEFFKEAVIGEQEEAVKKIKKKYGLFK